MDELQPYEQRFIAEYKELSERAGKLKAMLDKWERLDFEPKCSYELLMTQYHIMMAYLHILCERADIEGLTDYII